jgi:hypothetical protein
MPEYQELVREHNI